MQRTDASRDKSASFYIILKDTVKKHRYLFLLYIILHLVSALAVIISAKIRSQLVDGILLTEQDMRPVLILLLINIIVMFFSKYGIPVLANIVDNIISEKILLETEYKINKKKASIPFYNFEDLAVNDQIELIKDAPVQLWMFLKGIVSIITVSISVIGIFFLLSRIDYLLILLLVSLFIPIFYYSIKAGSSYYSTWEKTAALRRYCNYQRNVLLDKQYAQERILFGFAPFFKERWEKEYNEVRQLSIKEELRGSKKMQISGILFCIYIAFLILFMIIKLSEGVISLGYAVSMISIIPSLFDNMIMTVSNEINTIVRAKKTIEALGTLYSIEDEEGDGIPEENVTFSTIEFKNVSFKYPNAENWILKDLCMKIENGNHYAIVGENGVGKSTIIKLLLRLYRVTEGAILIDGQNINDIKKSRLMGLAAALFQDFQRYYTNIAENIGIGDIRNLNNMESIIHSAKRADFHECICSEINSYDTVLGKMHENGVEFSGGEWQKLCIARLIMSPCSVKILDEPTASMDPVFEHELYRDFNSIMQNKTTISISHRLASCKNADIIYVIKNGHVIEFGSHEDLMENENLYCKMYTTQKKMYA